MFSHLEAAPADAILGLTTAFKADTNPDKVNLGVGVFKNEAGHTPVMKAVKEAERILLETQTSKSYLPINGSAEYAGHVQTLLFGQALPAASTCHTPGGTGALRVGGDFIRRMSGLAGLGDGSLPTVWVSTPTWANHKGVFGAAGLPIAEYPYYDPATKAVNTEALLAALRTVPKGDVVLLHVCCHNPTGADIQAETWAEIRAIAAERGWIPFFDFAYQGFGDGLDADRAALVPFVEAAADGMEFFVASSFSKNFGLYNERVGAVTFVANSADVAPAMLSHLKKVVRTNYSNPASHGGSIVETIFASPELTTRWEDELATMRGRIKDMRSQLVAGLVERGVSGDWDFINKQRGMFSYSGLSQNVVDALRAKSVYVVNGGRINIAGLTPSNIGRVSDAIADVVSATV